jgi:hypothetical protein
MTIISFLANIRLKTSHFVVLVITSLRDPVAYAEPSQPGALDLDQKVYPKNFSWQPAVKVCIAGLLLNDFKTVVRDDILPRPYPGHFRPV